MHDELDICLIRAKNHYEILYKSYMADILADQGEDKELREAQD